VALKIQSVLTNFLVASQADAEPDGLLKKTGQEILKALTFIKVSSDTHSE